MTAILSAQALDKRFGTRRVLAGASFVVDDRDRIGLIGANGAGKSTLLAILVGDLEPDAGAVTVRRGLSIEYVPQEPRLALDATIAMVMARDGVADHDIAAIARGLGLPRLDATITTLSLGERRRVALGRALLGRADLLALDEPTNHLDASTIRWLEGRLAAWPGALITVTHDRYFLDRVATRILEVDRGKVYGYDGGYADFLIAQTTRLGNEAEAEHQRAAFVRREIEWIRRGAPARTTKAKARIDRFDAAVAAAPGAEDARPATLALRLPTGPRLGSNIVELAGVHKQLGGKTLVRDLTLVLKPGDRIGIVGDNGSGKTTLIRMILGLEAADSGEIVVGVNTRPAYLEQGRIELRDELTVLEEVGDGYDHVELPPPAGRIHVRGFLRMMAFPDDIAETKVGKLSGGERNRVQLARLLRRGGNLLVLDEPTNDLDLPTLGALEEALVAFPGCALIVSHDRWFLDRVVTAILAFEGRGRVVLYEGSYSFYAERAAAADAAPTSQVATPRAERKAAPDDKPKKLGFNEVRELAAMESTIAAREQRVAELEAELADPAVFTDWARAEAATTELAVVRADIDRLFARWQELEARAARSER